MRQFAITGYPLVHSMSAPIHERLFALSGRKGVYQVLEIPSGELDQRIAQLKALCGFNVTIPHKCAIIPHLSRLDEKAKLYGAVNVVHHDAQGWTGYNTDVDGFTRSIVENGIPLDSRICVMGAGGAGRMACIELALQGAGLTIAVRDRESSIQEADKLKGYILSLKPDASVRVTTLGGIDGVYDLLVNTTPVGMYPKVDASPVDASILKNCGAVFDIVYNPSVTLLMRQAQEAGCKVIGGMSMLVWQAVAAHEIWDGVRYRTGDINSLIEEMIKELHARYA
ncbi:shikimate dehydrogenase family protein [Candidatus Soleaferrea massiliensis]|uniref:shikimate dehydrogenase family protein n=1 Tax=Candidatus Soleaferrea massiliensis TaxID=1470354 RepID=UPI000590E447|nr:shikimate dehydrogenase [Candidatus Soleaferrea massiliensis]